MRKPRHLSAEERSLWDRVAERTKPLEPIRARPTRETEPKKAPMPRKPSPALLPFEVGEKSAVARVHDIFLPVAKQLEQTQVRMDHKAFGRLRKGKLDPDGRIDLHGMTLAEAHSELTHFVIRSYGAGRRLLLVITGKGKDRGGGFGISDRMGVLRHHVPQWLSLPPLAPLVLQVVPSHVRHGGHGAYYVYLKKPR